VLKQKWVCGGVFEEGLKTLPSFRLARNRTSLATVGRAKRRINVNNFAL